MYDSEMFSPWGHYFQTDRPVYDNHEPRVRVILVVFYRAWTERLARMVSNSRVCGEQEDSYGNKGFAFHGKL